MLRFLLRKFPSVALVVVASSIIAFLLPRLVPGDPAVALAGGEASPETLEAIRKDLGLDQPLIVQYVQWVVNLVHGDFGNSYLFGQPVTELIGDRIGGTLQLAAAASLLLIIFSTVLGVLGGSLRKPRPRMVLDFVNSILLAAPPFLTGIILILAFGIVWKVLPISGEMSITEDPVLGFKYLLLPALALALPPAAMVGRLIQTQMLMVRGEDFVDLAKAKGVPPLRIALRHVMRNSLGTAIVAVGLQIGHLLAGTIIIEAIFARNGLGSLALFAVMSRDYLVIQTIVLFTVLVAVIIQLISEILLAALDPRVRLEA